MRSLVIDFSAMTYLDDKDCQFVILDGADQSIIPDTKTPKPRKISHQLMTQLSRIMKAADFIVQKGHDPVLDRLIKLGQLFKSSFFKINCPFFGSHFTDRVSLLLLPGYRFFLGPHRLSFLLPEPANNLHNLRYTSPKRVSGNSFWNGGFLQRGHPVFFPELRAILRQQAWKCLFLSIISFYQYRLYNKIYNIFLVSLLFLTSAYAKDLGVYGETFPIAEENLLTVIRKKLTSMEADGSIAHAQQEIARKAGRKIRRPSPVKGLIKTQTPRRWFYDPSMTVESDIKDPKGNLIAAKGSVLNPLDKMSWGVPLLLFDGDDPAQVAWAETQHSLAKWVLVKGSPVDLEEKLKRPVYFDQAGMLVNKFGIQQVPCRISQKDKKLLVEELTLERKGT